MQDQASYLADADVWLCVGLLTFAYLSISLTKESDREQKKKKKRLM